MTQSILCAVGTGHRLARRKTVALRELADEAFVVYAEEDYPEYMAELRQACRTAGFRPNIAGEYDGATGLITAVESGRGLALVASTLRCLSGPRLVFVPLRPRIPALSVAAVRPAGAPELVEKFVRTVQRTAQAA